MAEPMNIDFVGKIKKIEQEKVLLLKQVTNLYSLMANAEDEKTFVNISKQISDIIITCCLLGKQYGVNCNIINSMIDKQIRLYLCENQGKTGLVADLQEIRALFVN